MNMFGSNYKRVGIGSAPHKGYMHCTVIDFFGVSQKAELSFEKYQIDKEEWPENAVSLQKHIESKTTNNSRVVY